MLTVPPVELGDVIDAMGRHRLDFDDAYQYVVAERHGLVIVSFDADLDRTPIGRKVPRDVLT